MMKFIALMLLFSVAAMASNSEKINCDSWGSLELQMIKGSCNNGQCAANIEQKINASDSCWEQRSVSFSVNNNLDPISVTGLCQGTEIIVYRPPGAYYLKGECTNGGTFDGIIKYSGGYLRGTCNSTSLNLNISPISIAVYGTCIKQ